MFIAFKVISKFYSCKAIVEFTIVCFDGIDVIGWFRNEFGIVNHTSQIVFAFWKIDWMHKKVFE